jgi:hypothetical protein
MERRRIMEEKKMGRSDLMPSKNQNYSSIVELRQYSLLPGQRDVLIDLFDREFIESQEALGMKVIGQFRDLNDPNNFVWLRGFSDMSSRGTALASFYGGQVWKAHREQANATMVDSSNVLMLRPAREESGFTLENSERPPYGANVVPKGLIVATIYYLDTPVGFEFIDFFEQSIKPELMNSGTSIIAYFVTESSVNNFPALPVREGENVFVWFSSFSDEAAYKQHLTALAQSQHWHGGILEALGQRIKGLPEVRMLLPTARSQLHS